MLKAVSDAVDSQCSTSTNPYDATAAMGAVISYCIMHDYTVPSNLATITIPPGVFVVCLDWDDLLIMIIWEFDGTIEP
jgi:hypothetical protein